MKKWMVATFVALLLVPLGCGSSSGSDKAAGGASSLRAAVEQSIKAENAKKRDAILALWTDHGLSEYDSGTREEIASGKGDFAQEEIRVVSYGTPDVKGDKGTIRVDASTGEKSFVTPLFRVVFSGIRKDGTWKLDGFDFKGSPPPGPKATVVGVTARDYEFALDRDEVPAGEVGFRFTNAGKEQHEITFYRAPDGVSLEAAKQALQDVDGHELKDIPAGYQVQHVGFAEVGQKVDVSFAEPLRAGTYVLTCYVPQGGFGEHGPVNPKGMAHIKLGMIHLLTVT